MRSRLALRLAWMTNYEPSSARLARWPDRRVCSGFERRVEGDVRPEKLRNGAPGLGGLDRLIKIGLAGAGHLRIERQVNGCDGEPVRLLLKRHVRFGCDPLGDQPGLLKLDRQGHRKASRVRRADQFLRVRAGPLLETR